MDADDRGSDSFEALLRQVAAAPEIPLPLELEPGVVLDDNFEIIDRVGAGGMGVVYRARDRRLGREVAIKLHVGHTDDRLMAEAVAMARLAHPNVITVHEVGTYDGHLFIAMEFIDGDTARGWLEAGDRSTDEILEVFCQAGRGLEAAHDAGLVHRDFKPDNIFIGADGRVCVGDFGLARQAGERGRPVERETSGTATATSAVVGTLAYMAPEQIAGKAIDARADQFAFSVSLWEALSGTRPFDDTSLTSRRRSLDEAPELPELPEGISRRVAAALRRGLDPDPGARFPSMTELLAHITPEPRPSRAGWIAFALATIAAAAAITYAATTRPVEGASCAPIDPALGSIWTGERRAAIERAFSATELSYASGTFAAVSKLAGDYASAIAFDRERACREARSSAGISTALYQRRLNCLRRRERSLDSLLDIFERADTEIVAKAVTAAGALPPVSVCGDESYLASEIEPPEDAATAAAAEDLRAEIGRTDTLATAGKLDRAASEIAAVIARARKLEYPPVLAEALLAGGRVEIRRDAFDKAAASLREGYLVARRAGANALAGQLAARLALLAGTARADRDQADLWSELATIEVDRGAGSDSLELAVLKALGELADFRGEHDKALDYFERAHVLAQSIYGDEHPEVVDILGRIAGTLHGKGDLVRSASIYEQALAAMERSRGADHPDVGLLLRSFGLVNAYRGEAETARRQLERSHTILSATLGPRALDTGYALLNLGVAHDASKDYRGAIEHYKRALEIVRERLGPKHPDVSLCLNGLAVAHEGLDEFDAAIGYLRGALEIARTQGKRHPQVATVLGNIGALYYEKGEPARALAPLRESIGLWPAGNRNAAIALTLLGESLVELGRLGEAREPLERALKLLDGAGIHPRRTARAQFALARVLRRRDRARAIELATSAEALWARDPEFSPNHLAAVRAWLEAEAPKRPAEELR